MNMHLIRANATVLDGWPVLVAFALYLIAFGIVALTTTFGLAVV